MATRTQARESVIGLLYAYDLGNEGIVKYVDDILEDKKIRNKQKEFALNLFNGVVENLSKIDEEIISHLNQGTLADIGSVEKSILRLAVYEIQFAELEKAIIINEAIELSKKLASDGAPKFMNGLLDKVSKA
ncbi:MULTISPECIES: transcription antitermination factor NusB [Arcobacteraceae]|uniref:Transcription antitermination protein NusB n=1 Tax=Poseidonibacter parvus TaxID=1850254 RepID=A0A1P8KNW2_9BACT|nr:MULTISPECIES: transcription antitermination factor NusB [Arcobacteraceae]APW66179.1 N utilization substance protein B [Poseidonibacter parvus]